MMSVLEYITGIVSVFLIVGAVRRLPVLHVMMRYMRGFSLFGLEFLVLGILLALVLPDSSLSAFEAARSPLVMFCISWAGFFFGCGLELRTHQSVSGRILLLNLLIPLSVFTVVTVCGALFLFIRFDGWQYTGIAILTGAFSSFMLFPRREIPQTDRETRTRLLPPYLLPLGNFVPVILLTVSAILLYGGDDVVLVDFVFTGSISVLLVQCLLGIGCGMILNMLLSAESSQSRIVSLMIGVTALGGGLAYTFSLSPLFIGMLSGMFLINATLKRLQVLEAAGAANAVIEKLFMLLLGTLIPPLMRILETDAVMVSVFAITLVAARVLINVIGGWFWSTYILNESAYIAGSWIGFAGQGMLAAAAAVESALKTGLLPAVFFLFLLILLVNQIGMGTFIMTHSAPVKETEAENA